MCRICLFHGRTEGGVAADVPMVTLAGYMKAWGVFMVVATLLLTFLKKESMETIPDECSISDTYKDIVNVIRLPNILST
jgi:predicted metal-binding membrane protein